MSSFPRFFVPSFFIVHTLGLAPAVSAETVVLPEIRVDGKRLRQDERSQEIYSQERIERESGRPLGEILRESAGVDFISSSGGIPGVTLRGSTSAQVLVIIDGVKVNDPSSPNRGFDWSRIDVSRIERIEILKGPQAVSYGSDAIGGAILITTKRGPTQSGRALSLEAGSRSWARVSGEQTATLGQGQFLRWQIMGKGEWKGLGAESPSSAQPALDKESKEVVAGLEWGADWDSSTRSSLQLEYRVARRELDQGAFDPDPNSVNRNREFRASGRFEKRMGSGLEWKTLLSQMLYRNAFIDDPDASHSFGSDSIYEGMRTRVETQLRSPSESTIEWVAGAEWEREGLESEFSGVPSDLTRDHQSTTAVFGETLLPILGDLSMDLGARASRFTSFGSDLSGKAGLSYAIGSLSLDASLATGLKAPSLFNLYSPMYGDPDLQPEESVELQVGARLTLAKSSTIEVRAFQNRIRNRFGFDPVTYRSLNVARADIRGIELTLNQELAPWLRFGMHATYLDGKNRQTGFALQDLARWKGGVKLGFDPSDRATVTLSFLAKSKRFSGQSPSSVFSQGYAPGFGRVDLAGDYRFDEAWSVFGRVENLLNRDDSEMRGYRPGGFMAFAGIRFTK
jgi:vitamin B12 transporter